MTSSSWVRVVYDYHYSTVEGQPVHIHIGDEFELLKKTSAAWWYVRKPSGQNLYVPTDCVEEVLGQLASSKPRTRRAVSLLSKSDPALNRIRSSSVNAYVNDEPCVDYSEESMSDVDEERGECFDNPLYALPSDVFAAGASASASVSAEGSKNSSDSERNMKSPFPEYVNMRNTLGSSPPIPGPEETPVRIHDGFEEFEDSLGRRYYYHSKSNTSSWKPPRKLMHLHNEPDYIPSKAESSSPSNCNSSAASVDGASVATASHSLSTLTTTVAAAELSVEEESCDNKVNPEPNTAPSSSSPPLVSANNNNNCVAVVEMETRLTAVIYSDLPASPSPLASNVLHGRHVNFLPRLNRTSSLIDNAQHDVEIKDGLELENEKENKEDEKQKCTSLPMPPKRTPPSKDFNELRQLIANKMALPERSVRARSIMVLDESHMMEFEKLGPKTGGMKNSKTLPALVMGKTWRSDKSGCLQGFLNVTRFSENGRRIKKQWMPAFLVLMDTSLYIFKPPFTLDQSPEILIDLPGATIKWSKEKSHRKNVLEIAAADGSQVLIQDDNKATSQDWVNCIMQVLNRLPSEDLVAPIKVLPSPTHDPSKSDRPLSPRIARLLSRNRSTKVRPDGFPVGKNVVNSADMDIDLSPVAAPTWKKKKSADEMENADIKVKKMKIIERLKNFFSRRPTLESLKAKGIIRDGPVFGCNFVKLCEHEHNNVPTFVRRCIAAIEKKDMKTDGIYRVSGNLSQVQKLRFQIDQDKYQGMETEDDVNVLTGLLKLFFRELKEPMIPFAQYDHLMKANKIGDKSVKDKSFKDLVNRLPLPNMETLRFLFQHLHRIAQYGDYNRMRLPNLAIVFGPTLMWPETPSINLATDMLCQNQVVEYLLLNFHILFENINSPG